MGFFLETLFGGLMSGMLYALIGLGFVLIFKASGVFNFAQGAMVLVAALSMARFSEWIPRWLGFENLLIANILAFIISALLMSGLFKEYYRNPKATEEARDADGWFHTGDAGYLDSDGQLKIIDRAKDVGKLADGSLFAPKYLENKLKFFPHIKEAVAFGADRDHVCAFVNIDLEAVGNWAERRGLAYAGYTDLAGKDEVYQLIETCIEQINADLANDPKLAASQISRFLILHKELDPDDDELTRTRKVRRAFIAQKYGVLVEALFAGRDTQFIETDVKFEDGRIGKISADIKIRPVKTFPAITAQAA